MKNKKQTLAMIQKRLKKMQVRKVKLDSQKRFFYQIREGKINDITSRLKNFETVEKAILWLSVRIHELYKSNSKASITLAESLEYCLIENCDSAACPICYRQFRRWYFAEVSHICRIYRKSYAVTILLYGDMLTDKELFELDPKKYMDRLRQQLIRIGYSLPVIGSLEFDYHSECGKWLPHFHLLMMADKEEIEPLRKYYKEKRRSNSSSKIDRPMKVVEVKDYEDTHGKYVRNKAKAISYTCKSFSQEIRSWTDDNGRRRTKKFRLDDNRLRLSLRVFDRIGFGGLLFLYNVRRDVSELVVSEK